VAAIDWSDGDTQRYELCLEARYCSRYNGLQARFYSRVQTAIRWALLIGGAASVGAVLGERPMLQAVAGITLAALAAIDILLKPGERAARFDAHRRRYDELDAGSRKLSRDELHARLSELQRESYEGEIELLRQPAFNDTMIENGRPDAVVEVSGPERFFAMLA
jgi:hypothetical protein